MTSNLYAIRGEFAGINTPVWLRLYRHRDTAHTLYMTADGKTYTKPGTEADKAFNGPLDPPTSGKDGRYFWIRQQMPAEKTFPQGFEYVLMGVVTRPGKVESGDRGRQDASRHAAAGRGNRRGAGQPPRRRRSRPAPMENWTPWSPSSPPWTARTCWPGQETP